MTIQLNLPSVRSIRTALEEIAGAIGDDEPLPEGVQQGTDPATEVLRIDLEHTTEQLVSASSGPPDEHLFVQDDLSDTLVEEPTVTFEVPPQITDAEVKEALGEGLGNLERLQQIRGADALGWYVTFHQRKFQHGVHIPVEGVAFLAVQSLSDLQVSLSRSLELAFHAILRHELYHFAVDCMAANWELATNTDVYWKAKKQLRGQHGYVEFEEALANAYLLRGFRHPTRLLAKSGGASAALKKWCLQQPPGYRDGPHHAASRYRYVSGCRELSKQFQHASGEWRIPEALDTLIFYPDPFKIDWTRCPIIIDDRRGLLKSLGIQVSFISALTVTQETPSL